MLMEQQSKNSSRQKVEREVSPKIFSIYSLTKYSGILSTLGTSTILSGRIFSSQEMQKMSTLERFHLRFYFILFSTLVSRSKTNLWHATKRNHLIQWVLLLISNGKKTKVFKREKREHKNNQSFLCIQKNENNVADSNMYWQETYQQKHSAERFVSCAVWNSGNRINRAFPWLGRYHFFLLRVPDGL
jgi:hypothetical protein